jgi:hypothetical protein
MPGVGSRRTLARAAAVLVLGAAAAVSAGAGAAPAGSRAVAPCRPVVRHDVIPPWARTGFSGPRPRVPYALGRAGRIVAILFGYPLRSPPGTQRNNKILWVSRTLPKAPAALWIRAQRLDGATEVGAPVRRIVAGGPGPSIVDLPEAGCWRLTLTWSGRTDALDLAYGAGG